MSQIPEKFCESFRKKTHDYPAIYPIESIAEKINPEDYNKYFPSYFTAKQFIKFAEKSLVAIDGSQVLREDLQKI